MILMQEIALSDAQQCQYLPDRQWRFRYFFASQLDAVELDELLRRGWRKFGYYYFRPSCRGCQACVPIRVRTEDFKPSKNQKELLKKNRHVEVDFGPLEFDEEVFRIYKRHSMERFGNESSLDEFVMNFYSESCPALQSNYYVDGKLAGVGFLDRSSEALSSVYFIFDTDYSRYSLGTYSVLKEIEHAASLGLPYYYLGYYIPECDRMRYKGRFRPHELFDWNDEKWSVAEE